MTNNKNFTITTNKEGGVNAMKTENLEMNTIQRKYHFESGRQAYTAWITIDTEDLDLKVVYRPKEFPELSNLPDIHMPIIIIQNDNNPNERFDIGCFGNGIWIDSDKDSFEAEEHELKTISFYEQVNTLTFYLCENAYADLSEESEDYDEYEDDDDAYEVHKIPCDKRLAAFMLNYIGEIDIAVEFAFWKNNEFADSYTIKDFIIED